MPPDAVEVVDLVKRYGDKTAVDGLSLTVPVGSITAVLGPNGAGKTTTIETCEGYRRPDSGTVRVLGLDPWRDATALRPRVGVMLQVGGVYPSVKAFEMLRHVASLHSHPLDIELLAERLGLGSAGGTPYRRLSGGQQQRLSLAMAVVGRPELVFLDEPTAGLDPQARRGTWELLEELRRDGVSVVLTTHYMDEAERLADRVVILDHGQVIAVGSPRELTARGAGGTLRFGSSSAVDTGSLEAVLPDGTQVRETTPGRYLVTGDVDPWLLAGVTTWCAEHQIMPEELSIGRRTLEDVFIEMTGRELRA
jgi:ABC-2 type transport system ATP-binding protein